MRNTRQPASENFVCHKNKTKLTSDRDFQHLSSDNCSVRWFIVEGEVYSHRCDAAMFTKQSSYQDRCCTVQERTIRDVGMTRNPTNIRRAKIDISNVIIECVFMGCGGIKHVTCDMVEYTLRNTGP